MKGLKTAAKYPYKGKMLQVAEIIALPECTKSKTCIRQHLKKGKTLEEIFAIESCPVKAKTATLSERKAEAKRKKAADKKAERDRKKAIMAVPVNPKYTHHYYMPKTPKRTDDTTIVALKQNAFTTGY